MPSLSFGLHPAQLAALAQGTPPPGPTAAPPPGPMGGAMGGGRGGPVNPFVFPGGAAPGPFGQPAPFNPLLAQMLLGLRGGAFPGAAGAGAPTAMLPRGPLGAFGLTPPGLQPERQRNPYR